jgi:hypothetical protein
LAGRTGVALLFSPIKNVLLKKNADLYEKFKTGNRL